MKPYFTFPAITLCFLLTSNLFAQTFATDSSAPTIIELYTSEGCSSCPPADSFLSQLAIKHDPFESVIPLAYHVDYWNYIGWEDRFSRAEYSNRQRRHVQEGNTSQVYTPGFVVNNKEWRAWFRGAREIPRNEGIAGQLSARLTDGFLDANYSGHPEIKGPYLLNVAYLGMGISTQVKAGENKDRKLKHDYVVLDSFSLISQSNQWQIKLDKPPEKGQQKTGIAIWVSSVNSLDVLQADAALLDEDAF